MKTSWILISLSLASPLALSQDAAQPSRAEIASKLNGVEAGDLHDSVLDGFYEVRLASRVGYISTNGRYLLEGNLYDLEQNENLTENARANARVDVLASVDPAQMIVFAPEDGPVKHTVTIFTDIDCGYCRQFHREIDKVTAMGVQVNYLFYPRTGPATDSWSKAERVWCAGNRNTALTNAKLGGQVPEMTCSNTPVSSHYDLGHLVGVTGTPSVYAADGTHIGGYLPPDQLIETLNLLATQ